MSEKEMLDMSQEERRLMGAKTTVLALTIIRSAIDTMLLSGIEKVKKSSKGEDELFAKTFMPLVDDLESDKVQEAFFRAADIFSKESSESRLGVMENMLQIVWQGLTRFGDGVEAGKEFADAQN